MAWGAVAGAAIGAIGPSLMGGGGSDGQGGQQQTVSKDPWSSAAPWLQENIKSGQALQGQYAANPFNAQQVQGYNNQYSNADYMRSLTGSVLGQLNGFQPFDRGNQDARPQTFQFPSPQKIGAQTPYMQAPMPAPVAAPAAPTPAAAPAFVAPEKGADNPAFQSWKQYIGGQGYGADVANYDYWRAFVSPDNQPDGPGVGGY